MKIVDTLRKLQEGFTLAKNLESFLFIEDFLMRAEYAKKIDELGSEKDDIVRLSHNYVEQS